MGTADTFKKAANKVERLKFLYLFYYFFVYLYIWQVLLN